MAAEDVGAVIVYNDERFILEAVCICHFGSMVGSYFFLCWFDPAFGMQENPRPPVMKTD